MKSFDKETEEDIEPSKRHQAQSSFSLSILLCAVFLIVDAVKEKVIKNISSKTAASTLKPNSKKDQADPTVKECLLGLGLQSQHNIC